MKILAVHNQYQQAGGEDRVFIEETALLEAHGHRVVRYRTHNDQISAMRPPTLAKNTLWNSSVYRELRELLRRERPRVAHFHNTFPLISSAGYYAAKHEGVPVVQTLHNYRLLCPNGLFFRDGRVCEDCLDKAFAWPGIVHKCYRDSHAASGLSAAAMFTNRALNRWSDQVGVYVSLTEFARRKMISGGLPADKIAVKPNFVHPDPGVGDGRGGYALFVGRLSPEKGIETLLRAWALMGKTSIPLKIAGDGPLAGEVARAASEHPRVEWIGYRSAGQIGALMKDAGTLIFPSEWYETFGRVAIEAFASGTPVIAADIGAIAELVESGRTGLRFRSGDAESLARQVEWLHTHAAERSAMRREARAEFEARYTAERNYRQLSRIYDLATGGG